MWPRQTRQVSAKSRKVLGARARPDNGIATHKPTQRGYSFHFLRKYVRVAILYRESWRFEDADLPASPDAGKAKPPVQPPDIFQSVKSNRFALSPLLMYQQNLAQAGQSAAKQNAPLPTAIRLIEGRKLRIAIVASVIRHKLGKNVQIGSSFNENRRKSSQDLRRFFRLTPSTGNQPLQFKLTNLTDATVGRISLSQSSG